MDISFIVSVISAIAPTGAIFYLVVRDSRSGSKEITKEVISNYAILDKQQKDNIQECRDNLTGATKAMHEMELRTNERIAKLEGVVQEKDNQLQTLNKIVSNRNPELEGTLMDIKNFMKNINDFITKKATEG